MHKPRRRPTKDAEVRQARKAAMQRLAYRPDEFAAMAGISRTKLYDLWRHGEGPPYILLGNCRLIDADGGRQWLAQLAQHS
jgi:hypothetical protein